MPSTANTIRIGRAWAALAASVCLLAALVAVLYPGLSSEQAEEIMQPQ